VSDIETDERFDGGRREVARARGYRSIVHMPMLREGRAIGTIGVTRQEAGPFAPAEIALLQTFADQAVIAIENVRLFTELQEKNRALTQAHAQVTETLEQQTATSEVLKVISSSPTDVQPVFDAIVRAAVRLCGGYFGVVTRYDRHVVSFVAEHNIPAEGLREVAAIYPGPPNPETITGRVLLSRTVVQEHDVRHSRLSSAASIGEAAGYRTIIGVPMLRDGEPIGTINVARREVEPFSNAEISLLKTFADQAVIAIENVRLFNETKEALDRQTATSEILSVISSSPTDLQPVFDAIAANALRLCAAPGSGVYRFDGELIHVVALRNIDPGGVEAVRQAYPMPPTRGGATGRAILTRALRTSAMSERTPSTSSTVRRRPWASEASCPCRCSVGRTRSAPSL
jgi:two-component system NtrC family sensor kinase